eukprot:TRINITY_DN7546_c0_g1_i10.p1 TRINITY_DN7546_c0_g1~~TRINITY_DN7546_c0_g1_i10.p1  ORF type:complete len:428 (-),score=142.47 TRINITY_DN7546_c0_g1_i10:554-1837(-)
MCIRDRYQRRVRGIHFEPMSFRELRNFTEVMKSLGYPRIISIANFRQPNFELVADVLYWLLIRYDPNSTISDEISTESDRVKFIREVCNAFGTKARVKLNPRKIYASDGYAVKELLKIANMLNKASETSGDNFVNTDADFTLSHTETNDMRVARALASEITSIGLRLYELLKKEETNQKSRQDAIAMLYNNQLDMDTVEREIREMSSSILDDADKMKSMCKELDQDESTLREKIEKKTVDLDRCHKRLKDLENVRPAFMDEFEKLEEELQKHYAIYVQKFRNLEYLEHQLEQYNQVEQEKLAESKRALERMHKRLREEELKILRGEQEIGDNDFNDTKTSLMSGFGDMRGKAARDVYGSLSGGDDDGSTTDSDLGDVLNSDDSGLLSGSNSGDEDQLIDDDDEEDDEMSDLLSGDATDSTSVSDNEF